MHANNSVGSILESRLWVITTNTTRECTLLKILHMRAEYVNWKYIYSILIPQLIVRDGIL